MRKSDWNRAVKERSKAVCKIFRKAFCFSLGPLIFLSLSLSFVRPLGATFYGDVSSGQHEMKFRNGRYLVYLPPGFNSNSRFPLVFIPYINFSGRGMTVEPGELMQIWKNIADQRKYVVILANAGGVFIKLDEWYEGLIQEIKPMFSIDRKRVLVTGFGDGAHYAIHLGTSYPEEFTAVAPLAGTLEGWWKGLMRFKKSNPPSFYFLSGAQDTIVPSDQVETTAKEMEKKGYAVRFERLEGIGHTYTDEIAVKIADWFDSLTKAW